MVKFDRMRLEKAFGKLPHKVMVAISARAAMRVLPMLAIQRGFAIWPESERSRYLQAVFACYHASFFSSISSNEIKDDVRAAASAHASTATQAYKDAHAYANAAANAALSDAAAVVRAYDSYIVADAIYAAAACNATKADREATVLHSNDFYAVYANTDAVARASASASATLIRASIAPTSAYAFANALERDLSFAKPIAFGCFQLLTGARFSDRVADDFHTRPLWSQGMPAAMEALWRDFQVDTLALNAGFEVWLDWYRDRLAGEPFDLNIEREWARLSKERRAQSPAEINVYLASIRNRTATKEFRRVRVIFIGHGGAGKSSLIEVLHGNEVIEGKGAMTPGVAIQDASMAEEAGIFTEITDFNDDDLTVHFWDFGGQVMAHATHQFFLRANCLYVIVLDARPERNANEEAEYWLEHVRAFGDRAPVLIVGNKSDVMPVNLDLRGLKQKYPNIADFYPLSCTKARDAYKAEFERFNRDFRLHLTKLGEQAERFTSAQFTVLKTVQEQAKRDDFLAEDAYDDLCRTSGVAMEGPGGRASLLGLLDTLGVVLHFPNLPFLTDYVLNPRWLTYGVYSIMYSDAAKNAKGRIHDGDLVRILRDAKPLDGANRTLRYPADKCRLIADAMVEFRVAYRLTNATNQLVIPALLEPQQPVPAYDFKREEALAFRFDFKGFLPRHVLPALIVDHHPDIANEGGEQVVWQNGVVLRSGQANDAEALITADYHTRNIDILVQGSDANTYLSVIRDSICRTLKTMPKLPIEEKVQVRPDMRVDASDFEMLNDAPVWADYKSVRTAQKYKHKEIAVGDHVYDLEKVLTVMPVRSDIRPADVFISYAHKDRAAVERLAKHIKAKGHSVWYDLNLIGGQRFRDVINQRIDAAKAVVAVWTENSVGSDWVVYEASRANNQRKLVCLRSRALPIAKIPGPFPANHNILQFGQDDELMEALVRLCKTAR